MKKFEIGKEYFDRSACNHDCIFTIKIIKRTEKTVRSSVTARPAAQSCSSMNAANISFPNVILWPRSSVLKTRFSRKRNPASRKPPKRPAALRSSSPPTRTPLLLWWVSASNVSAALAILRRAEPSSALLACLIPVSFTAAFSLWSCMTAQRLLNVSACPTFTAAGGALPAVLRWVCSSPDALPGRRFPPLPFRAAVSTATAQIFSAFSHFPY